MKMKVIIGSICIFVFFFKNTVSGQNAQRERDTVQVQQSVGRGSTYSSGFQDIIHPSPESQNFTRYGEFSPLLATGTINIPIPLYTLNAGDISIPFELQYATNGIKVNDSPYPAGLGWSLKPAFRITRTIMGRPDEFFEKDIRKGNPFASKTKEDFIYLKSLLLNDRHYFHPDIKDSRYDIFTVHLPHETFKFIIEGDKTNGFQAITVGSNATVIIGYDMIHNGINNFVLTFEITDDKGIKYFFGLTAVSGARPIESEYSTSYPTAWGLSKIVLPGNQGSINFTWNDRIIQDTYSSSFPCPPHGIDFSVINDKETEMICQQTDIGDSGNISGFHLKYPNIMELSRIDFPLGYIEFVYGPTKPDVNLLKEMNVFRSSTEKVKEIKLNYGTNNDAYLLKSLIQDEEKYEFEYNPVRFDECYGQDYWGYYNGKSSTFSVMVPKIEIKRYNPARTSPASSFINIGSVDRSVDDEKIQANILTKIIYPTGGYSTFEYETHKFDGKTINHPDIPAQYRQPFTKGGGVRIKTITSVASGATTIIKSYEYGNNGKGFATVEPTIDTFIEEQACFYSTWCVSNPGMTVEVSIQDHMLYRTLSLKSQSDFNDFLIFDVPIWYDKVTEYTGTGSDRIKTEYQYKYTTYPRSSVYFELYDENNSNILGTFPKKYPYSLITIGYPSLIKKNMYKNNVVIKRQIYNHSYHGPVSKTNVIPLHVLLNTCSGNSDTHFTLSNNPILEYNNIPQPDDDLAYSIPAYAGAQYELVLAYSYLDSEKTVEYYGNDSIVKEIKYQRFNYRNNHLLRKKLNSTSISDNNENKMQTEEYLYPHDNLSALTTEQKAYANNMLDKNRVATPIRVEYRNNNVFVSSHTSQYKDYGNDLILPEKEYLKIGNNTEETRVRYHNHDSYGNPTCVSYEDGPMFIYVWGYKGQYPVAKIESASKDTSFYTTVKNAINAVNSSNMTTLENNPTDAQVRSIFTVLRGNKNMSGALISSYSYKPLVGMTSETDPSGRTIFYEYDAFGRLKYVKDEDENILKYYDYNYGTTN